MMKPPSAAPHGNAAAVRRPRPLKTRRVVAIVLDAPWRTPKWRPKAYAIISDPSTMKLRF
jgi:hypothetical protein